MRMPMSAVQSSTAASLPLQIESLEKHFGEVKAVNGVSLEVRDGVGRIDYRRHGLGRGSAAREAKRSNQS